MSLSKIIFLIVTGSFVLSSCTEAYPLLTNTYQEAIVVEANLTNELKKQEIKITKSSRFEDKNIEKESGAEVFITDDLGTKYDFEEESENYISKIEFQALSGRKYQLHINTNDGRSFESSQETLTKTNPMQEVKAAVETNDSVRGVSIRVRSFDPNKESKYYRYKYEETYKIVAPRWVTTKVTLDANENLIYSQNSPNTRICYSSKKSTELLLTSTTDQDEDRLNFQVRFISDQDYIITTRYSILVTQYIESLAAYTYYKTLKKMSGTENILSPKQPGILLGNIKSINNPSNKIIGYFDVASVSTERIYFNYPDLFLGEAAPPYYTDCTEFCYASYPYNPDPCTHGEAGFYRQDLQLNLINYFQQSGNYLYWINAPCGDCTTFSSNIKPTFWID